MALSLTKSQFSMTHFALIKNSMLYHELQKASRAIICSLFKTFTTQFKNTKVLCDFKAFLKGYCYTQSCKTVFKASIEGKHLERMKLQKI